MNTCLLAGLLALAACGGDNPPAATITPPNVPAPEVELEVPLITAAPDLGLTLCRRCSRSVRRHQPGARIRFSRCRGYAEMAPHLVQMEPLTPPPV